MKILKSTKHFVGVMFLCSLFFAGYFVSQKSWDGQVFIRLNNRDSYSPNKSFRNIASVKPAILEGRDFKKERQKTLVLSGSVENQNDGILLHLGHFLVKSKAGESVLACQEYQTLDMTFIASGMSVHGHVPKMVIKVKCKFNSNQPLRIGPFFIPTAEILQSPVDRQLFNRKDMTIMFSHVSIRWPDTWTLSEVRFIKEHTNQDLRVSFSFSKEEDFLTFNLR